MKLRHSVRPPARFPYALCTARSFLMLLTIATALPLFFVLCEAHAQKPAASKAHPKESAPVAPGAPNTTIGDSGFSVPIPEIRMKRIIRDRPVVQPSTPERPESEQVGDREPGDEPAIDWLPFDPARRRPVIVEPAETPPEHEGSPKEAAPSVFRPPVAPEDYRVAPAPRTELLKAERSAEIPQILVAERVKDTTPSVALKAHTLEQQSRSGVDILLSSRWEPKVIPPPVEPEPEPERVAKAEPPPPVTPPKPEVAAEPAPAVRPEPPKRAPTKGPAQEPEKVARTEPPAPPVSEPVTLPKPEVAAEPAPAVRPERERLAKAQPPSIREPEPFIPPKPEVEATRVPSARPGFSEPPAPARMEPPAPAEEKTPPEETPAVQRPPQPIEEIIPTPLAKEAPNTPALREYLRAAAPILEELSLLMTRAPTLAIADYDPSDVNAAIFPEDIYLKLDAMKRQLQILDAKTFSIIPPKDYTSFHATIRDSITETYQACDTIMRYMHHPTDQELHEIQTHLSKARHLIQKTRTGRG